MTAARAYTLNRRKVVARLLKQRDSKANQDLLIVTGLGSPTYDVHAVGDNDKNFYLWGAMGGASLVGYGLVLCALNTTNFIRGNFFYLKGTRRRAIMWASAVVPA